MDEAALRSFERVRYIYAARGAAKEMHHRTIDSAMNQSNNRIMPSLTANDLKVRGIAAIEESLANSTEALVSVRGKDRFVVMDVAQYHYLRECELDAALAQSQADVAAGRYLAESAQQHMHRLDALLAADGRRATAKTPARKKGPAKKAATGQTSRR